MSLDINFMVGGEAGQGVQSVGFVLAKSMARGGYHVFADQDYESRVRGGHNFYRVRADDNPVQALSEQLDVLIALNRETIDLHRKEVKQGGLTIYDGDKVKVDGQEPCFLSVPFERLATEAAGNKLMTNSVAVGAALGLIGYDFDITAAVLKQHFAGAGEELAESNVKAARAGLDYARQHVGQATRLETKPIAGAPKRMLLNGNEALALGAMAAGCKFVAAYPMTPTTSVMEYMADKGRRFNVVVVQPEDEIAAMNMVVGAGFAGVRAMTATSGGGFCLMVEGLSLAGMTETPAVIVMGQRAGPAIGLPTRTEQGELWFVLHAGHGEFPRAVLAPATVEDCFHAAVKAFNLAEKYQVPVIILTDHHLSSSYNTVEKFDLGQVKIERGLLLSEEESNKATDYKRYRFTESGISPRGVPLQGKALVVTDSDEHDEAGHIIEDAETRTRMMLKRMRKQTALGAEISRPRLHQSQGAQMTLVGWGSTYGAIKEAAAMLGRQGIAANVLQLSELWPFPADAVSAALDGGKAKAVVVENNATGQLARL
ncbi:MAG: 2-oxoacid:acceptor oxidoreductase subunit alpha, partial [Dehalococcoidia bacterium]|nr:2-oxoacid:acceptor oxidoreductase subunit alpha [Dehalococcoidia bacterium]